MTTYDFGRGPILAHRHNNPDDSLGGWVAEAAYVRSNVYVGPDALVYGQADIRGNVRITGRARVHGGASLFGYAEITDDAEVTDYAVVEDRARVGGNARISGYGRVTHNARVEGNAVLTDNAYVGGYVVVDGNATVSHDGVVTGRARVSDRANVQGRVDGDAVILGTVVIDQSVIVSTGEVSTTRQCSRCNRTYPESDQYYSKSRGRWNAWCRTCAREYSQIWRRRKRASRGRSFGVEIEFHGRTSRLVAAMQQQGLSCHAIDYSHAVSRSWKIVPDGSVTNGAELVSPILFGEEGYEQLRKASRALVLAGCTVSTATGLHVHHDVRDLTVSEFKTLVRNWHESQDAINWLVSRSRRGFNNSYCRPFRSSDLEQVERLTTMAMSEAAYQLRGNRYVNFNLQSYGKYGTVEIRQHQGTTDAAKMIAWVQFGQAMIKAAVDGTGLTHTDDAVQDVHALLDQLPLPLDSRAFLHARASHFIKLAEDNNTERVTVLDEEPDDEEEDSGDGPCTCPSCQGTYDDDELEESNSW